MRGRGAVLGGRYALTERIGGGGMGTVWRADDAVLARKVAVKILHAALFEDGTFVQRFRREAQLVAAIDHPGIVDVHDYGESPDGGEGGGDDERCAYIVMELIDGRPLDQVLAADGPMAPERALTLIASALDALHAAHQQMIVHRDIKPSNLMVRADGRVTITDFGIARAIASTKITASHAIIGTALYMAPEQAEGKGGVSPASDLYSIGVVCYELLTGKPPFVGESVLEVALKHVRDPAPELPDEFPPAVRELVAKALAKKPEDRHADAAAMAAAARAAIGAPSAGAGVGVGEEVAGDGKARAVVADASAKDGGTAVEGEPAGGGTPNEVAKVEPQPVTDPGRRRSRRALLVPVIVPIVISIGTATVLLIDRGPGSGGADAKMPPGAQPAVVTTAPVTPGTGAPATPSTTAPATPAPGDTAAASTAADQPAGTPNQPPQQGQPPATGGNGATASGAGGAAVAGGKGNGGAASGGGGVAGGQANPAGGGAGGGGNPPAPNNNPHPPQGGNASGGGSASQGGSPSGGGSPVGGGNPPAPPTQPRPADCGGNSWSRIVNEQYGLPLGLANDSLSAGNPVVLGGASQYGWVGTLGPGDYTDYNACNKGGPLLVQNTDGTVSLNPGFSFLTAWVVRPAGASGTYTLAENGSARCMTANGVGNVVTMTTCTPGLKTQQWRLTSG
ncbi:serine/threonine protein kinase [Streptomyces kaniharaensis]|uniref:non-specific serine/threonine protein kinase n=1 Tax=Streptomyces kaniharaensis TaxID=212423 RepID=A0A6N7KU89_9ACTN|nr:serine/threonine-protein kinase [Streptomyces kaniharaensis]MQS15090.1 serine/threonine protein kinase [Streptomyces kaniharaensis]